MLRLKGFGGVETIYAGAVIAAISFGEQNYQPAVEIAHTVTI